MYGLLVIDVDDPQRAAHTVVLTRLRRPCGERAARMKRDIRQSVQNGQFLRRPDFNPDPSEGPWGGGLVTHHGGAWLKAWIRVLTPSGQKR